MSIDWKGIGQKLASTAPLVGAALGGPSGATLGTIIAHTLGVKDDPETVDAALIADPNAMIKLRQLQADTELELKRLAITEQTANLQHQQAIYSAEVSDRESARNFAAKDPKDRVRPTITFALLFSVIFVIVAIFGGLASEVLKDPTAAATVGVVVGYLFGELKTALGFYFGSTAAQDKQSAEIAKAISKPQKDDK